MGIDGYGRLHQSCLREGSRPRCRWSVRNPLRAASPSFGCSSGRGKKVYIQWLGRPNSVVRVQEISERPPSLKQRLFTHCTPSGKSLLRSVDEPSLFACPTAACCSLAVLLEPKQRRSTTAKKGPTDCRGRPLVEVSGPSFRRTAKARSLPGQLSIGPFQQSRFSTAKVPTVEHKKNKGFLSRDTTRQLSVRKCFSGRLPIQHSIFRVLWRSPRLNCPMLDARRTRLNVATRDHL